MKSILTLLWVLLLRMSMAQDNPITVHSNIKQATVFLEGAQVTRQANANLPLGVSVLILKNLSPKVVEQSIQAEATQGVKILAVSFSINYLEVKQKPAKIALLEAERKKLAAQLRQEVAQEEVYKEEEVILKTNKSIGGTSKGVEVEQLKLAMDYFRSRLLEIKSRLFEIDKNIRTLNEEITRTDNQLKELSAIQEEESGTIIVKVSSKAPVPCILTVKYLVKNAKWFPSYDIRARDVQSPINITYKANISQQSGEDWENVELTISSGNPMQSGERPFIQPWILGFNNHKNRMMIRGISIVGIQSSSFVQGRVTSAEDGSGLPGVNVVVKGTTVGTVTDAEGNYSLSLPANSNALVFSFIGMQGEKGRGGQGRISGQRYRSNRDESGWVWVKRTCRGEQF
ncbi:MAG: mucoidy inhibitor MuiA family protein [Cytophagales bacterium]